MYEMHKYQFFAKIFVYFTVSSEPIKNSRTFRIRLSKAMQREPETVTKLQDTQSIFQQYVSVLNCISSEILALMIESWGFGLMDKKIGYGSNHRFCKSNNTFRQTQKKLTIVECGSQDVCWVRSLGSFRGQKKKGKSFLNVLSCHVYI